MSARVCSTESCRCAATAARSSDRMRAVRSSARESSSRRQIGRGREHDADEDHQRGDEAVAGGGQLAGRGQQQHHAAGGERRAAGQRPPDAGDGEGAVGVQLPPDDDQPAGDQRQRQDDVAAEPAETWPRKTAAAMPRTPDADPLAGPARLGDGPAGVGCCVGVLRGDRHGQPQQHVGDDPDEGGREDDEGHPDDERVLPEVRGGARGDPRQHPPGPRARERWTGRRPGRRSWSRCRSSHRATPVRHR